MQTALKSAAVALLAIISIICAAAADQATADTLKRKRLGWVETMRLYPEDLLFEVKLTPGSEGNVLHAENIEIFKKNGTTWLRFSLSDRNGLSRTLERKLIRRAAVRTSSGKVEQRYQVRLAVCLDTYYAELNFSLRDRSTLSHEARIGREALAGVFVVDPGAVHVSKPNCERLTLPRPEAAPAATK